jgi:murein DD-endopeptidase MepM/ murein hydrolase activator NlpD
VHPSTIAAYLEWRFSNNALRVMGYWVPVPVALMLSLPIVLLTTALVTEAAGRLATRTSQSIERAMTGGSCQPASEHGAVCAEPVVAAPSNARSVPPSDTAAVASATIAGTPDDVRELSHRIRAGETISQVLDSAGVKPGQIDEWVRATNEVYDLNRIYVGQEVSLLVDAESSTLHHMALEIDPVHLLVAKREDGDVIARREPIRHDRHLRVRTGTITSNLYTAGQNAGVPEKIVSDMADIFGWELNLSSDLQPGSTFRVIYEELSRADGSASMPGMLLAAEIMNQGHTYEVFHFLGDAGEDAGYYTRRGESLGSTFLRYPVAFHRISSKFSQQRFHPVLKRAIPHNGVDFAAPRGTPVKAIADGTVRMAGWYGGNGRFVKIRHGAVYASGYAHLSRIAKGITSGGRVKKGQVIGYVGSTGQATGPHLHFAMYRNGKYVNPLTIDLPRAKALSGESLTAFQRAVDNLDLTYAQASTASHAFTQLANATVAE